MPYLFVRAPAIGHSSGGEWNVEPTFDIHKIQPRGVNIAVFGDDFAIEESETIEAKTEEGVEAQS